MNFFRLFGPSLSLSGGTTQHVVSISKKCRSSRIPVDSLRETSLPRVGSKKANRALGVRKDDTKCT